MMKVLLISPNIEFLPDPIFPLGLEININRKLQKKIRRLGARGPLWEYMKMGQRFKR